MEEKMERTTDAMENQPLPNFRDICDEVLAQLQKAHELTNHMVGTTTASDDGSKQHEPNGSVEKLGQQIDSILKSVVALSEKLNRIERAI